MRFLTATVAGATLALSAQAATPSFDCRRTTYEAEQMICKDAELADLDHQLTAAYDQALARTPARKQAALKAGQRDWIRDRNDCSTSSDQRGCIRAAYENRIEELERR